jgi:hypothetical protein
VGAAVRVLPVLGVLRGPLGAALVAIALVTVAKGFLDVRRAGSSAASTPESWPKRAAGEPRLLFAVGFALLAAVALYYTSRLRVSGDEPHYLIMAQSLWRDHDLDLANNYGREDFLEYTPGPVRPHYGTPRQDGRPFPAHSPGLPFLLAPVYAAGGRAACVVLLALMAAALALEVRTLALRDTGSPQAAFLAWAATLGPPVFFYSFHVYTEVPSALSVAAALRLLLAGPTTAGAIGAALLASALPWLHVKMIAAAVALGVVALVRLRGRARVAFVATSAAVALAFAAYYERIFGHPTPLALYGGLPADAQASPGPAALGLLLDRSFGLLPHAPIWLLALPGVVVLCRRSWAGAWPHLLVGLAVVAPVLSWRMWWGGLCPPARFLVPLVALLGVAVAQRAVGPSRGLWHWRFALLLLGCGLALFATARPGRLLLLNRGNRDTRLWAALSGETPVQRYLPSLTLPDAAEWRVAAVWVAALVLLLVLDHLAATHAAVDRLFRGLGLPLVLLLMVGLLVDGWARTGQGDEESGKPVSQTRAPPPGRWVMKTRWARSLAAPRPLVIPPCISWTAEGASGPSRGRRPACRPA